MQKCEEKKTSVNGETYGAPADYHLLLEKDRTGSLYYSEKVNYFMQSINITIKSLSEIYSHNLIATLLSDANFDCA